ncbi:hypothetical protein YC2023_123884 [Brassica napus]
MISGAGDAFSRRRWPPLTTLLLSTEGTLNRSFTGDKHLGFSSSSQSSRRLAVAGGSSLQNRIERTLSPLLLSGYRRQAPVTSPLPKHVSTRFGRSQEPSGSVGLSSLNGLSLTRVGSSVNSPAPLSTIYANPAIDVGGTPLRRPDLFLISGNPLRRPVLNHLFMKMASDVGGNPLRRPALSHQKLVRSVFRRTTLTSSSVVERTSLPCLPSMIGENLSVSFPSFSCSLLTGLLPCGAVRTGPEGAIETTSVFLVGEDCLSTSLFMNCPQEDV